MRSGRSSCGGALLVALFACLVLLCAAAGAGAPREEPFTLAVVRRDAIAIPFATFDGKRWKNAWPMPETHVTAPITLADIPKRWWTGREPATRWTFWPVQGPSQPIDTISPTWFPTHCMQQLGLRTTYRANAPIPPLPVAPYPKDGIAVAGTASIIPIELLDAATAPMAREITREIASLVSDQEKRQVNEFVNAGEGWTHPYSDAERRETPLQAEALYRVARGLGERDVYYVEAVKHYAVREKPRKDTRGPEPRSDRKSNERALAVARGNSGDDQKTAQAPQGPKGPPCDLVTFVGGWLARKGDEKLDVIKLTVAVTSCDFAGAFIMLPLAVANVNGKPLWIAQWSGWTHEQFSVLEVQDRAIQTLITTRGGSCAR